MTHKARWSTLVAALVLMGCDHNTSTAPVARGAQTPQIGALAARAIAVALAEVPVRQRLLIDLRDSPYSEHKVVLQDYLRSTGGLELLSAMRQAGINVDSLTTALSEVAPIQFYLPSTAQRASWRGTPDILVVPDLNREPPSEGFGPTGATRVLDLANGLPSGVGADFFLQWAEPMYRRWAGSTEATETIQQAGESQIGSGRVVRDAAGRMIGSVDDTPESGAGPRALIMAGEPAGTYLTTLVNHGVCDNLCTPGEHLEFEFRSTATDNPNTYISAQLTGISQTGTWTGLWQVHTSRVINGVTMTVQVWEVDGTSGDDPFYCQSPHPNCHFNVTNWPWLTQGASWAFPLCENSPFTCNHLPSDLEVAFTDRSTPVVTTVTVSPATATIYIGGNVALTATARDQYGSVMSGKVATWTSLNTSVATVASTGNLTATGHGVGVGQTTLRATIDGVNGNMTVTVNLPPLGVTISGPQQVTLHQSAQYFANASGGVPPYTYEWRSRQCSDAGGSNCGSWQNWFSTGSQNYTFASVNACGIRRNELQARVTDSRPVQVISPTYAVLISNPC